MKNNGKFMCISNGHKVIPDSFYVDNDDVVTQVSWEHDGDFICAGSACVEIIANSQRVRWRTIVKLRERMDQWISYHVHGGTLSNP